jgi:hypothetical protein
MASTTDILPVEGGTGTHEAPRPPRARRGALAWAAVVGASIAVAALVVATFAYDDADIPTAPIDPQAEVYERQAHLDGQARTYGRDRAATAPSPTGNAAASTAEAQRYGEWASRARQEAAVRMAEAERIERQAHLEAQARAYRAASR